MNREALQAVSRVLEKEIQSIHNESTHMLHGYVCCSNEPINWDRDLIRIYKTELERRITRGVKKGIEDLTAPEFVLAGIKVPQPTLDTSKHQSPKELMSAKYSLRVSSGLSNELENSILMKDDYIRSQIYESDIFRNEWLLDFINDNQNNNVLDNIFVFIYSYDEPMNGKVEVAHLMSEIKKLLQGSM